MSTISVKIYIIKIFIYKKIIKLIICHVIQIDNRNQEYMIVLGHMIISLKRFEFQYSHAF